MKLKAITFEFEPRIALYLVPETEIERTLLQSLWKHGKLELTHSMADNSGQGFAITARKQEGKSDGS